MSKRRSQAMLRWVMLWVVGIMPLLVAGECTDERGDQIRADIAAPVSTVWSALGDVAGAYFAALIRPLPEAAEPEPSLK